MATTTTSAHPPPAAGAVVVAAGRELGGLEPADRDRVAGAIAASRAAATHRAYNGAWRRWAAWCGERGARALPADPAHVAAYLAERHALGRSASTLAVERSAIAARHREAGEGDPTQHEGVRLTLAGLRRSRPGPPRRVDGLGGEDLERVLAALPAGPAGRRDRAIVLVMRDAMLRRSEAAALTWGDVLRAPDGNGRLTVRQSKTDQAGEGATLYLTGRTLDALAAHVAPAQRSPDAPIFRAPRGRRAGEALAGRAIGEIVRRAAARAGLAGLYGGHSLRRGTAQQLAEVGAGLPEIMAAGRWQSPTMPAAYTAYTANAEAGRGAVSRYRDRGGCGRGAAS